MIDKDSWQKINDKTTDNNREVHDRGIMDREILYIYHILYIIIYK